MFAILGFLVVLGCVVGGFILEGGNLHVLIQPIELLIIGGAALGSFLISSPPRVLKLTVKSLSHVFLGKHAGKQAYLDILLLCYDLSSLARRDGALALESHANDPGGSAVFSRYASIKARPAVMSFLADNLKVYISGGSMEIHDFENLMDLDIESHAGTGHIAPAAVNKVADALPGLGIVAAVLGVVLTMGKLNEPPEVLGHSIGAALVGTFLGVLMCYGFVGPMAANLEHQSKETEELLGVAKAWCLALAMGWPPAMAVEMARRAVPSDERPAYEELEGLVRGNK